MKNKYPHLFEYQRRCKLISEADDEYYSKFEEEICREHMEINSIWMARNKLGEKEKIHKVKE